ncbi:MAG: hypothetical protein HOW97_03535 [Catenulispora sp.]|nr:hypothetical protein [Catenulispora sp.]NUR60995.1 hypothetical protein [Catenulispora sp.]
MWTRVVAALHGEVSAATWEAYRDAGQAVFDVLAENEEQRKAEVGEQSVGAVSGRVATWNALVLQLLGEALMDADYAADPKTVGFLPKVTAEQVGRVLTQVEPWLALARQGQADPSLDLTTTVHLPAVLPAWVKVEPCPPAHLAAMIAASARIAGYAEAALADAAADPRQAEHLPQLRQMWAEADTAGRYAEALLRPGASQELHEAIEDKLRRALEVWYRLGQLAADPRLHNQAARHDRTVLADPSTLPGGSGFDPWCLTAPNSRDKWRADPRARRAIDLLWAYDPAPAATLTIQAEIDAAFAAGDIVYARTRGGQPLGHYFCCPWGATYEVRRQVRIAGKRLAPHEQFVFDVSGEELAEGGKFIRRLVRGPFEPTKKIDYCDPEGGHDDDD